jgi:hypothetical protein
MCAQLKDQLSSVTINGHHMPSSGALLLCYHNETTQKLSSHIELGHETRRPACIPTDDITANKRLLSLSLSDGE